MPHQLIYRSAAETDLRGQLLTSWRTALKILRKVKRWEHLGIYVQVEEVTPDEAKLLAQFMKKHVDDGPLECVVQLLGPKVVTPNLRDCYFVVQVDAAGKPTVSRQLREVDARKAFRDGYGVKSYLCQAIDSRDTRAGRPKKTIY